MADENCRGIFAGLPIGVEMETAFEESFPVSGG